MNENLKRLPQIEQDQRLTFFVWKGQSQSVEFAETERVAIGVECDVYSFPDDAAKDLGIIRIQPGFKTPRERVLQGKKTITGHIFGKGKLIIERGNGEKETYEFDSKTENKPEIVVNIGNIMQWQAAIDSHLTAYEICFPPYKEGRYEYLGQSDLE